MYPVAKETSKKCVDWCSGQGQIRYFCMQSINIIIMFWFFFVSVCGFAELMLLGFMSLILAVTQTYISNICIPTKAADTMLPCRKAVVEAESLEAKSFEHYGIKNINGNLSSMEDLYEHMVWQTNRRLLANDTEVEDDDDAGEIVSDSCSSKVCH